MSAQRERDWEAATRLGWADEGQAFADGAAHARPEARREIAARLRVIIDAATPFRVKVRLVRELIGELES